MKRLVGITGIILIICVMMSVNFTPSDAIESLNNGDIAESIYEDIFVIRTENNRIVVYKKGESEPYMQTDTRTDNLPKGDIVYLEKGIEIIGKENLKKALEDYCS